jgi:integrase
MVNAMKDRYRLFQRGWGIFYAFDNGTGNSKSLKTRERKHAERLVQALNEAEREPMIRKQVGSIYLRAADPQAVQRTWQRVMDTAVQLAPPKSRPRWQTAIKDKALAPLGNLPLVDTRSDDFLQVLAKGTVATNVYLRRLQNLALDLRWIVEPVLNKRRFPKPVFKKKRAITFEEHCRIIEREKNKERKAYYQVLWFTGGAQTDIALLEASQIDWGKMVLSYRRHKNGQLAQLRITPALAEVLRQRPNRGLLFPYLAGVREKDRANEFRQRCQGLNIQGVTLHSYRYSWAQRAKAAGYPQRYAQQALGHASKAVAEAYAAEAQFVLPALEEYEQRNGPAKIIDVNFQRPAGAAAANVQA